MRHEFLGERVCAYAIIIGTLAAALAGMWCGSGSAAALPAPAPRPSAPPVTPSVTHDPGLPAVLTFAQWRAATPITIATAAEMQRALIEHGFGWKEAEVLADAAEAPVREVATGTSIGIRLAERGDNGLAHGGLAVRVDYHPELALRYDLDTVDGAAGAAWEIRSAAGGLGPWYCVR